MLLQRMLCGRYRSWRRSRRCCLLTLFLLCCALTFLSLMYHHNTCSMQESRDLLDDVCLQYSRHQISGDLCDDLCVDRTITFQHCLNYRGGKKILISSHQDSPIVLKSFKRDFDDLDVVENMNLEQFYEIVTNTLHFHFNVSLEKYAKAVGVNVKDVGRKFTQEMWHGRMIDTLTAPKSEIESFMYSMWVLLHQEEYITMQTFQSLRQIPRILGTCGSIYAMESCPPGAVLSQGLASIRSFHTTQWKEKAEVALGLLDLVDSFSELGELHKQLHMCDIKGENFGIGADGTVKAIDVDMAFVEDKLASELGVGNCSKHSDCDFFECLGWCNIESRKCSAIRRNNNLQSICYKLFLSKSSNALQGLLSQPPDQYADHLMAILQDCVAPPAWEDEITKFRASDETKQELRSILEESLSTL